MRRLTARIEAWPLQGTFRISRGAKTEARTVVVEIAEGDHVGRGESVPYPRYDETPEGVVAEIESRRAAIESGLTRDDLLTALHAGAARNAIDCALWDLEAKQAGRRVWELAGLAEPAPCASAMTLSLDTPENMGRAAAAHAALPLLKLKVTGEGDLERIRAVHENAPQARLIVDANEGWRPENVERMIAACAGARVELIEQPLPAAEDGALRGIDSPVPLCADESCVGIAGLNRLRGLYDFVNVKLDKAGGLTGALALTRDARSAGFGVMVGCMVGTSLAMAPAMLAAQLAEIVDLDGPLILAKDREHAIRYKDSLMHPPDASLWG